MEIRVHVVMEPEEEWICIPQGENTVIYNRANDSQLTSAQELKECILNQVKSASYARDLRDAESLSPSGREDHV